MGVEIIMHKTLGSMRSDYLSWNENATNKGKMKNSDIHGSFLTSLSRLA